jgi:hypothetical protein
MTANHDDLKAALERALPCSLDDIIRRGRDQASLGLATSADLERLMGDIVDGRLRVVINGWHLVALRIRATDGEAVYVYLLGYAQATCETWITSNVVSIDMKNGYVRTKSGSI